MKNSITIAVFLLTAFTAAAQDKETILETTEQQLENLAEINQAEPEDDTYLQQLSHFRKHPLNINTAEADELASLALLSAWQVEQLLAYRKLLGKLISKYELQAVPGWDPLTIKKVLPYIRFTADKTIAETLGERWKGGDKMLLLRYGRLLEKAKGYGEPATASANHYLGSRDKVFIRYGYRYKNLLQWGLLADKDAGEQLFKGGQRLGFDFYSFHFFARKLGRIQSLALGDFTVNFGQGLLQWQSLAFKKSTDGMAVKRQSAALRPYSAAGEYNFHRGAGITLQKGKWETTLFASLKKVSANTVPDSLTDNGIASSFNTSGYHRTPAEMEDRHSVRQMAGGINIKYKGPGWHAGISSVYYHFSKPLQKPGNPYNLFALRGQSFLNTGIDYSYTWRNIHLFGEAAADAHAHTAFLNGALISLDAKAAVSLVYRNIAPDYQSVNANAFTENAMPVNEQGLYAGITLRPLAVLRLDAYADIFQFPWLKYRVDAPSTGRDYCIQATYTPVKHVAIYARYKSDYKMINYSNGQAMAGTGTVARQNLRLHTSVQLHSQLALRNRMEVVLYNNGNQPGQGFLTYLEAHYKPAVQKWTFINRLQYFETSGYNERIYTYEADLPYSFSIPLYFDKGMRYYFVFRRNDIPLYKGKKRRQTLGIGVRWAQTIYAGKSSTGGGLDETGGNRRSELKVQLILNP